jgi:hypothetical protein
VKQLGLLSGSNILGDEVIKTPDPYRTADGQLSSQSNKAILWYIKHNTLSLKSTGAYPKIYFGTDDGQEQSVEIEEIAIDYNQRDRLDRNA